MRRRISSSDSDLSELDLLPPPPRSGRASYEAPQERHTDHRNDQIARAMIERHLSEHGDFTRGVSVLFDDAPGSLPIDPFADLDESDTELQPVIQRQSTLGLVQETERLMSNPSSQQLRHGLDELDRILQAGPTGRISPPNDPEDYRNTRQESYLATVGREDRVPAEVDSSIDVPLLGRGTEVPATQQQDRPRRAKSAAASLSIPAPSPRFIIVASLLILGGFIALMVLSFKYVPRNHLAVMRFRTTDSLKRDEAGAIQIFSNGRYFLSPIYEPIVFNSTVQRLSFVLSLPSTETDEETEAPLVFPRGSTSARLGFTVFYRITSTGFPVLLTALGFDKPKDRFDSYFGPQFGEWKSYVASISRSVVQNVATQFSVEQLIGQRELVASAVRTRLRDELLTRLGLHLYRLQLDLFDVPYPIKLQKANIFDVSQSLITAGFVERAAQERLKTSIAVAAVSNQASLVVANATAVAHRWRSEARDNALRRLRETVEHELLNQATMLKITGKGAEESLRSLNLILDMTTPPMIQVLELPKLSGARQLVVP